MTSRSKKKNLNDDDALCRVVLGDLYFCIPYIAQRPIGRRLRWFADYVIDCILRIQAEERREQATSPTEAS